MQKINKEMIENMSLSGNRRDVLLMIIKESEECFDLQVKIISLQAKEFYHKFRSLTDSGFTPEQAMELIKSKAI